MALLDTLFGNAPQAEMLGGLLGEDKMNQLRSQATSTGLMNAVIGYLAQPKNQRLGSALPYIARSLVAGQQGAQGVYDDALKNWQMQQKMEEINREKAARAEFEKARGNLFTTIPAQYQEVSTPGGYAPQQAEVQAGQAFPNYGLTKLPDVTSKVMTAPEQQVMNEQALQQMMLSGDPRAASYLTGLKTLRELSARPKRETAVVDGNLVDVNTGTPIFTAPTKPQKGSTLSQLQSEYDSFEPNDPRRLTWKKAIDKEVAPSQGVTVSYGTPVAAVDAQGNPVFIQPSKEGGAPSVIPGYAPTPQKLGEATQKQVTGINNLQRAIQDYKTELATWKPSDAADPARRAKMNTVYNNMMLQAKEAYGLGVLNGPDYSILTETIANPTSPTGIAYGAYGTISNTNPLQAQAEALDALMENMKQTIEQSQPRAKQQQPQQQTKPKGLSVGQVVNGYRYKGGDPKNKNNWEKK